MAAGNCKYSCGTAAETLEWINAIIDFIRPYTFLINAHVVNFFTDRLWESLNPEWINCLRNEPVQNLLLIPSGVVQDHWPASLREFVLTLRTLVFPREQADLGTVLPGLKVTSLNNVLAQGMNMKKKHEVEVLSAIVNSIANGVRAHTIVDVGAGQGYLAQVLSFHYQQSVVAIDACSHHGKVTDARAERIKKHYAAQMRKFDSGNRSCQVPKTITCHVLSVDTLKALTDMALHEDSVGQSNLSGQDYVDLDGRKLLSSSEAENEPSLVLAGLHACGDLSVMMLRAFLGCEEIKAVISIGCCYNLLSEEGFDQPGSYCGFPMSCGVKSSGISLGKSSRDLACQSAERWRSLEKEDGLHNFELHAFRAAFQLVLCKYFPEVVIRSPSIGRQGKALRRKQKRRILESSTLREVSKPPIANHNSYCAKGICPTMAIAECDPSSLPQNGSYMEGICLAMEAPEHKSDGNLILESDVSHGMPFEESFCEGVDTVEKCYLFAKFSQSALGRLGLSPLHDITFHETWKEMESFADLVGPYWSIRAALGPVLETFLQLDRLLFLQEQGNLVEAVMLPIFDPALSPRNMAIIAKRI
ncbi:protein RRNAD1-like [Tripterygium wilfordii]|uniref:Protein RRNAD1-like n=2 Tax=Tripterygium wilfordii TaxID=458696 RepID=A0A7J7C221_TRIWF|nr:protein RRNAD1-like [Tripterygium wilfordii]